MPTTIPFLEPADEAAPLLDINTTPLIDVLLVLLIMLLINLPLSTHAIKMDLPHGGGLQRDSIIIEIDYDGSLYWNDTAVTDFTQLESFFKATAAQPDQPDVRLNANSRAQYDMVAKVLAAAQRNGIARLGFVGNERFVE